MRHIINSATLGLILILAASVQVQSREIITIGSGGVAGVYFPSAVAICKLMNRNNYTDTRCNPSSTAGSIYNINQLRKNNFEFALVQSDWQFLALTGSENFEESLPYNNLRAVLSLYPEPFTILVKNNSPYRSFNDLKGSRVNFGPDGSGQKATSKILLDLSGWTENDLKNTTNLTSSRQPRALCSGQIDAMIYIVGHPSDAINEAINLCGARLLSIEEATVNRLTNKYPFYKRVSIPADLYKNNDENVVTFGVAATLVTDARVSDDVVYHLVDSVYANFSIFKKLHPALNLLNKSEMASDALTAPLHMGALKYYREKGI